MVAERASAQIVHKPWGSADLRPWSSAGRDNAPIGEIWFQRINASAPTPALLLKLLFTTQPLSIQVHPGDTFAQSLGLANGKTEAWYILSASAGAEVAIGLKCPLSAVELRAAIVDGSIPGMMQWHAVHEGEVCFVPAGTIHAIGAGIVLAEIQQHSNATFRIFDYERNRELDIDNAIAVADTMPAKLLPAPEMLNNGRTVLLANRHFVLEKLNLLPDSCWVLNAGSEAWMLVVEGNARVGVIDASKGDAVFMQAERFDINVGHDGLHGLLAYPESEPNRGLLKELSDANITVMTSAFRGSLPKQDFLENAHKRPGA